MEMTHGATAYLSGSQKGETSNFGDLSWGSVGNEEVMSKQNLDLYGSAYFQCCHCIFSNLQCDKLALNELI